MKNINATKYEIACKISDSSFLCYHSALEYYGLANQVFNELVVGSITRFNQFEFEGITYFCKHTNNQFEINNLINEKIKVTSIERTLIDCIDDIDLAGGIEEVLNALENIKGLSENKLMSVLANYNKVILYQKVGYIFEQYNDYLNLSASFFDHLQEHLTNQVKYFLNDDYDNVEYNAKWKVIAPSDLRYKLREGL
jgi:predicted transcriptional regulator of viral defense system